MGKFSLKTLFGIVAVVMGVMGILRHDLVSTIGGLTLLFAMIVFGDEIWQPPE